MASATLRPVEDVGEQENLGGGFAINYGQAVGHVSTDSWRHL
jgi:hypothetical protein